MTVAPQKDTAANGVLPDPWKGKRILIVSPEAWGPVRLSKHHYASALMEEGAIVFFLGPDERNAVGVTLEQAANGDPFILHRHRPIRGLRLLPRVTRAWIEAVQLRKLAEVCGGPFDVLWNFDLYRFRSLVKRKDASLRIQHVMDLRCSADLLEPASHADLVIVVSPSMAEGLDDLTVRILKLPHAWMPRRSGSMELPSLPLGPRVGYLGNLAMHAIHWPSILNIASCDPFVQLFLMGPLSGAFGEDAKLDEHIEGALRALPNVHFTGPLPYDHVPRWLEAMDILLIAYDSEALSAPATSSHKLLEYLASGPVVLSSNLEDHADLSDLLVMAKPGQSIMDLFAVVIADLDTLNSPERKQARRAFAASRTYAENLRRINNLLQIGEKARFKGKPSLQ